MSLCPRAAAQALRSPPELFQHEYKHDAAYFDNDQHPQYTLHPSNRFGPDQEPLLEPQSPIHFDTARHAAPNSSRSARYVAWLIHATLPSSTAASDTASPSTSRSRKAWLPVLLIANLSITVVAFIAACVHYNTFTTLFLYMALLVVAFPLLSLSLLLVKSNSYNYKLQLPEFTPNSTPLSEQASSFFSNIVSPSSSPAPATTSSATTRTSRSCCPARLETAARCAQYIFAVIWFLAIVEWIFFQPIFPAGSGSDLDDMTSLIKASTPASTAPQPMKLFIASNLYNNQEILPTYTSSLKKLIHHLGPDNVFVSIYESHSIDHTKPMLAQLDSDLAQMHVPRRILSDNRAVRMNKSSSVQDRIEFLANIRNVAMQPLADNNSAEKYSHVLWINDIVFTAQDALKLLRTNNARYDQVCATDFIGNGFYDTWVTRDAEGETLKRTWPYFKRNQDVEAMREGRPFEVNSCWNGITAFDAKWFYPSSSSSPLSTDEEGAVTLPLKFRTSSKCVSSECQLISYDIHRASHPARPTILINLAVKVAYNHRHYFLYNSFIPSPIVRIWRIVWRDWIGYRFFGWVSEGTRWKNGCKAEQKGWAKASTADL
ncbi:hypothetical protein NDA16_000406 [Ustilago loliicola]|nr:hypothetical protein NDA16_000406 [Ustilago loliicola]